MLVGLISLGVGISIINQAVFIEVTNRVSQDLNSAWALFLAPIENAGPLFGLTAKDECMLEAITTGDTESITKKLRDLTNALELDFAGALLLGQEPLRISYDGSVVPANGDGGDFRYRAIERRIPLCGVSVLDQDFLFRENPQLAEQARTAIVQTQRAEPRPEAEETRGMTLVCAAPVVRDGTVLAVFYGGILVNGNSDLIDRIRDVVFHLKAFEDLELGTATVFLEDIRVATNVIDINGKRAIGTQVSKEVKDRVLGEGLRWSDRAFVVKSWYRTAYDPIIDIDGNRIGILYVGVLEAKYRDYRNRALVFYILIICGGIIAAGISAHFFARHILRPVNKLIDASREVSEGHLDPDIGPLSKTEIGVLQNTFANMLASFKERFEKQEEESTAKLVQSEKQAIVGRLAAGVAHEVNNPLTSVLTFSHLLLERDDLPEDAMNDLRAITESTERVRKTVRGLLDYSRSEKLQWTETDLNELIEATLSLVRKQIENEDKKIVFKPTKQLPPITVDRSQLQSVLMNLLLNAADAIADEGIITIATDFAISTDSEGGRGIEVTVTDTGKGIPPENLEKLFDPFFTTKEAGKGTGLGLAVTKSIVERHAGAIHVKSTVGAGSTFTLWLPLDKKAKTS